MNLFFCDKFKGHNSDVALEKQIRNVLLTTDDNFFHAKFSSANVLKSRSCSCMDANSDDISGWCPDNKHSLRKQEHHENLKNRKSLHSRDIANKRNKDTYNFTFYHYPENHKYIEQYRRENIRADTFTLAKTRSDFWESQRFYAYKTQSCPFITLPSRCNSGSAGHVVNVQSLFNESTPSNVCAKKKSEPFQKSISHTRQLSDLGAATEQESRQECALGIHSQAETAHCGSVNNFADKIPEHYIHTVPLPRLPTKMLVNTNTFLHVKKLDKPLIPMKGER